ncbi:outer membrane beta-barrel protein, partial [Chitinimonas sp.]|uniref:outer membrane beta-barrel protein n=1 Tax=Chitinimonas sp. TaxID=1934313 RepID=UPI0035B09A85
MKHTLIAALLAVAAVSAPALADGFYVGADVGRSQLDGLSGVAGISDSNVKATSAGVFGGYAFSPSWAVELGYHGLGKGTGQTKFKNVAVNYDTKVKATTLSVIGSYGVSDAFSVYGRLGYA